MLKEFIAEYKSLYDFSFSQGFKGEFERFCASVLEPKLHPSSELKERLNSLDFLNYEPPFVAIVGQFSSGKSSFLNALLGSEILPTGVVPVTAKPTFIKYAPHNFLMALYNDGRQEYLSLSEIGAFVDQRKALKDVKHLYIYLNNEILKDVSFIDTPGLNSRSNADTKETMQILRQANALIWISLINNAARASEINELELIPSTLKANALCLLNQKDRLNDDEIKRVLAHCALTYKDFFSATYAISALMELKGEENSGFSEVFSFLKGLKNNKESFIRSNCALILNSLNAQEIRASSIIAELTSIIMRFSNSFEKKLSNLENEYKKDFELAFNELKRHALTISAEIKNAIKEQKCEYFKPKKSILGAQNYEKISYSCPVLDSNEALSKLIYNDDKMSKIFRNFKREMDNLHAKIKSDIDEIIAVLDDEIKLFKARYETLRKSDELHSDRLFADIRQFSCDVYASFISPYKAELNAKYAHLGLFFERINIKISTNYQNSIRLSVDFLANKLERARKDYESEPLSFSLYYPKENEITERVLNELSYYEFESEFIGTAPFCVKFLRSLKQSFFELSIKNIKSLDGIKKRHNDNLLSFKELEKFTKFA